MVNRPWVYRDDLAYYDGPLDFYWRVYNGELMLFLLFVGVIFRMRYRRTGRPIYQSLANIFISAGFGIIALHVLYHGVRYSDPWFVVICFALGAVYWVWRTSH